MSNLLSGSARSCYLYSMKEEADKREHSTKPEVDDLTDYQSLNSLGRAGVAGSAKDAPAAIAPEESDDSERPAEAQYNGNYNDGADFNTVDNKARTNS